MLSRALLSKLTNNFFAKPRGLGEHLIETIEYLFEIFRVDRGAVRHLAVRLRNTAGRVKLYCRRGKFCPASTHCPAEAPFFTCFAADARRPRRE